MVDNLDQRSKFESLRQQVEALIRQLPDVAPSSPSDILDLIQELSIHQTELESQNEKFKRDQQENYEQKNTLDALKESNERYLRLVENLPDMVYIYSDQKGASYWSPRVFETLGYSQEDLMTDPYLWHDSIHPNDMPAVDMAIESVGRNNFDLEYRIRDARGNWHWLRDRIISRRDKGNATIFEGIAVDITEHKQLENALHQKARSLGERVKELNCLYEISFLREQSDLTMAEVIQRITDIVPISWQYPEIACSRIRIDANEYISEKFEESQWRMSENVKIKGNICGTIDVFYLEKKPSSAEGPFLKEERQLIRAIAERLGKYLEHVTTQAELQQAHVKLEQQVARRTVDLKKSKVLLQKVLDGFPDPLFLLDENMRIQVLNTAAAKYYRKEKDSMVNDYCYHSSQGKSEPCDGCEVTLAIKHRLNLSFERKGMNHPNRLEQVTVYQVGDEHTRFDGVILRIHDITDEKLVERQVIQNEKLAALGLMVSSIAHEIANPISAVTLNAPILKDYIEAMISIVDEYAENVPDFELFQMPYPFFRKDAVNIVNNMLHASERVESTLNDLRRLYGNRKERKKRWTDLKTVIDSVIAVVGVEIRQRIKSFEVNIPEDPPALFSDVDTIEQILTNLLTNAMHAADKKNSQVKIDAIVGNTWHDHLIIEVSDNGCGMDEEVLSKIFKPFFTTKSPGMGTGLGLYVCQDLVQDLEGRIEVQSEVDKGSVFRIVLPDFDRRSAKRYE